MSLVANNERGYAVIEVLFLATVIAILSSIVMPKVINQFQIVYADYLMKSLYSELMQSARRITAYKVEDALYVNKPTKSFLTIGNNSNKLYGIRMGNDTSFRKYKLPSNFSFKENFFMVLSAEGILTNAFTRKSSGSIKLINDNGKVYKPFIVFDSVGRIRFSNDTDDF